MEPQFLEVGEFREGFTHARLNGQWAILDQYGRLYIRRLYRSVGKFHNGRARVQVVHSWGFIDYACREVILTIFDEVSDFHEGLSAVTFEGRAGYISEDGSFAIKPQFSASGKFVGDIAPAAKNGV